MRASSGVVGSSWSGCVDGADWPHGESAPVCRSRLIACFTVFVVNLFTTPLPIILADVRDCLLRRPAYACSHHEISELCCTFVKLLQLAMKYLSPSVVDKGSHKQFRALLAREWVSDRSDSCEELIDSLAFAQSGDSSLRHTQTGTSGRLALLPV